MFCKKCKKNIPDDSIYCLWCGAAQKKDKKKKMYQRPDGLYEKIIVLNGKRVPFRGKTQKEVERKMLEFKGVCERGPLFLEIAEQWQEEHFPTLTYNSLRSYKPALRKAVEYFGPSHIKEIGAKEVKQYLAQLPKSWAQKTYKNYFLVLSLIFKYAAGNGVIDNNPAEYVQAPTGTGRTYRRSPTQEEIDIIKASTNKPFGFFAFFLLYSGCRRGEALALQFKDIDYSENVIHVTKSIYHEGNAPKLKSPKTEKGYRDILLLDILAGNLPSGKQNDFIFGENGAPLTASRAEDLWIAYQRSTGLTITPHIVRHGYASILHEAGVDPKDAQEMLGHANIATTLDVYTHITKKKRTDTLKKLNDYTNDCKSETKKF